jgi:hypothetical protein
MRGDTFKKFTERAKHAVDTNRAGIPPIVYLPRSLRAHKQRLTEDHIRITTDPPTIAENHLRIAEGDPLGFLLAIMNGQPIPTFRVEPDGAITVEYHVPTFEQRESTARWLAHKVTIRTGDQTKDGPSSNPPEEWDALVARRTLKDANRPPPKDD